MSAVPFSKTTLLSRTKHQSRGEKRDRRKELAWRKELRKRGKNITDLKEGGLILYREMIKKYRLGREGKI